MKNVYAGGRLSMRWGAIGRILFPFILVGGPLFIVAPFVTCLALVGASILGVSAGPTVWTWSVLSTAALFWFFGAINAFAKTSRWRTVFVPVGMLVFAGICAAAVVRGQTVEWKGRTYRAS
jgi:hypothetical protein